MGYEIPDREPYKESFIQPTVEIMATTMYYDLLDKFIKQRLELERTRSWACRLRDENYKTREKLRQIKKDREFNPGP